MSHRASEDRWHCLEAGVLKCACVLVSPSEKAGLAVSLNVILGLFRSGTNPEQRLSNTCWFYVMGTYLWVLRPSYFCL